MAENELAWRNALDERQRKAVDWAENYVEDYGHGATGHNDLVLIAKLARALDMVSDFRLTVGEHKGKTFGEILALDWDYLMELQDELHLTQANPDFEPTMFTQEEGLAHPPI